MEEVEEDALIVTAEVHASVSSVHIMVVTIVIALVAVTVVSPKIANRNILITVGLAIKHLDTLSEASLNYKITEYFSLFG